MSSAVKEKKDDLLEQATNEANQKQEEATPEQTENRSDAKERAASYQPDAEGRVSTEGLDQSLVSQAKKGSMFGEKDYARYLKLKDGGGSGDGDGDSGGAEVTTGQENIPQNNEGKPLPQTTPGDGFNNLQEKDATNMQSSKAYKNQMENDYSLSLKKTSGLADKAMAQADKDVNYKTQVRGLNDAINKKTDYYRSRTDMQTLGTFGDIWNQKAFDWKAPKAPSAIETTYDTDTDF